MEMNSNDYLTIDLRTRACGGRVVCARSGAGGGPLSPFRTLWGALEDKGDEGSDPF